MTLTTEELAMQFFVDLPDRALHTRAVVAQAEMLADNLDFTAENRQLLVDSAWYHDIGYGFAVPTYNFHPLDGAAIIISWELEYEASMVAYHTTARQEAKLLGLSDVYKRYPEPDPLLESCLTYADMTSGPQGQRMTFEDRFNEICMRYPADSTPVRAMAEDIPRLFQIRDRIDRLIA